MKISKATLEQIIREEYGRKYKTGIPDEEVKFGLDLKKYPTTPEELESNRIAQELEDAWVAAGNPKKRLRYVDDDILDMAMAVRDGNMTMEDALTQVNNLDAEGKAVTENKMKVSKATLEQIIREELEEITSENKYRDALLDLVGIRRNTTTADKPITPKDLGPEDEPGTERDIHDIDIGDSAPDTKEMLAAQEMTDLTWDKTNKKKSDNLVIYNVATYLKNHNNKIDPKTLNALIKQTRAEAENLGFSYSLEEGYEHEGSMARNQLGRTAELATMIQGMISDDTNLEEWVESKITKAQDYLSSVLNYMRGEGLSEAFKGKLQRYKDEEEKIKTPAAKLVREIEKIQSRINFEKNYIPNDRSSSDERKAQAKENIKELEAKLAKKQEELRKLREQ